MSTKSESAAAEPFAWPGACEAAVSLSFDDARPSQWQTAAPILARHGVQATFYVGPARVREAPAAWRRLRDQSHEIGNHTRSHPCSANFVFARDRALEDLDLQGIEEDILAANREIDAVLGVTPRTFAYPCGQTYVGRGAGTRSYVPVVARHFAIGRGAFSEHHNAPRYCDLAQVFSMGMDGRTLRHLQALVLAACAEGGWLVLFGHDVGPSGRQSLQARVLDEFCEWLVLQAGRVWTAPVLEVGEHVARARTTPEEEAHVQDR